MSISHETNLTNVKRLARQYWSKLTDEEKEEWYCGTGTIGFIEESFPDFIAKLNKMPFEEADDLLHQVLDVLYDREQLLDRFHNALSFIDDDKLYQLCLLCEHLTDVTRQPEGYYIPEYDITVVFSSINYGENLAVTGFYYGKPTTNDDIEYDCDWVRENECDT